ncbi:MAG TPA: OmpA family protein [Sphingomicrobium sp.]|nr:OmpA family protein [Sphingomicrobium sp.]
MRKTVAIFGLLAVGMSTPGVPQQRALGEPSTFTIFFDWGKPEIARDGGAILDAAATAFLKNPAAPMRLSGHTDRSGTADGNRRSALKRAEAVRDYLETRGVPRGAMTLVSLGEDRPLIATEDGVREVQNRRVEISFGVDGSQR